MAEDDTGVAIGFALFFGTYSTFLTRPGIYLEDLFVLECHRRRGVGRALLAEVRRIAEVRGAGRIEWTVLDWNESPIAFYRSLGADVLPDWPYLLTYATNVQVTSLSFPARRPCVRHRRTCAFVEARRGCPRRAC